MWKGQFWNNEEEVKALGRGKERTDLETAHNMRIKKML